MGAVGCTLDFPRVGCVALICFQPGQGRVAFSGRDKTAEPLEPLLALPETQVQVQAVPRDEQNLVFISGALPGQFEKMHAPQGS